MDILQQEEEGEGRFYIKSEGKAIAELVYWMENPQKMIIEHTGVSEEWEGKGLGKQLVAAVVTYARNNKIKIVPACSFAKAVIKATPQFQDVL
jgi:hypothetical protein